ncbi:hypothetical protein DXH95_07875 [Sphingorhabdus pulchriflava]|uniref:DUF1176 domain-containing protein n=1 Tax=Sphingorhabdus pulchriflava TaxID=2292257 RepID=A0A371BIU6_9SPHN|nr:hypothetical protein [Sphingorhabdus pulchriflava]RDV07271.1 hypothetical protein DXH95_07875 [Sphingorhabdus pulchriflava]
MSYCRYSAIFLLLLGAGANAEQQRMPDYLQDLDRPIHAGDWTLQCNGSQFCQIIGVKKVPRDGVGVRTVVMISRGIAKEAKPVLRLAFIDSLGALSVPPPTDGWRLYARGVPKMPPPIKLSLGEVQANGAYRVSPDVASKLIGAFRRWPGSVIRDRGLKIASTPSGNLDRLMRKMDRLQHPKRPRLTDAEKAEWLKEYHYTILRSTPVDDLPIPEAVLLACDTRTFANRPMGARIGPRHLLWTADCPEGTKILVQRDNEEPLNFEVYDTAKKVVPHDYAGLDDTSLLHVQLPRKGRIACGRYIKMGFTGEIFVMIEDRQYDRCRNVPYDFWPLMWTPTSWKYADPPPTNGGNAAPSVEGVETP